jgi:hypothetical protein
MFYAQATIGALPGRLSVRQEVPHRSRVRVEARQVLTHRRELTSRKGWLEKHLARSTLSGAGASSECASLQSEPVTPEDVHCSFIRNMPINRTKSVPTPIKR